MLTGRIPNWLIAVIIVMMFAGCSKEPPHRPVTKTDVIIKKIEGAPEGSLLLNDQNKVVAVVHRNDHDRITIQRFHPEAVVAIPEPLATASIANVAEIIDPSSHCYNTHIAKVGYTILNLSKFDNVHIPKECAQD